MPAWLRPLLLSLLMLSGLLQAHTYSLLPQSLVMANPDASFSPLLSDDAQLLRRLEPHAGGPWHSQGQVIDHWFRVTLPIELAGQPSLIVRASHPKVNIERILSQQSLMSQRLTHNHWRLLPSESRQVIYVLVQSPVAASFDLTISDLDDYWALQRNEHLLQGLFFGGLLTLIVFLLYFAAHRRSGILLAGSGYFFCLSLYFGQYWFNFLNLSSSHPELLPLVLAALTYQWLITLVVRSLVPRWLSWVSGLYCLGVLILLGCSLYWHWPAWWHSWPFVLLALWLPLLFALGIRGHNSGLGSLVVSSLILLLWLVMLAYDVHGQAIAHRQSVWLYPALTLLQLFILYQGLFRLNASASHSLLLQSPNLGKSYLPVIKELNQALNNQLHGIIGMSDLLNHTPINEQQREYLHRLQLSSYQLTYLNKELAMLVRHSGQTQPSPQAFDLETLLAKLFGNMRSWQSLRQTEISLNVQQLRRSKRNGHPGIIYDCLAIMLARALENDSRGQAIELSVVEQGDRFVKICIHSAHMRINAKEFYASRLAGDNQPLGLGLGLVMHLAKQMHGDLMCRQEGLGCSLILSLDLPIVPRPVPPEPLQIAVEGAANLQCLILDDDLNSQQQLLSLLRPSRMAVQAEQQPQLALELIEQRYNTDLCFTLLLIDQSLEPNGLHLLQQLRLQQPRAFNELTIVLLTSLELSPEQQQLADQLTHGVLPKPLFKDTLKRTLEQALHQSLEAKHAQPSHSRI